MRDLIDLARQIIICERAITSDVVDDDSARVMRWWMNHPPTSAEIIKLARGYLHAKGIPEPTSKVKP